MNKISYVYIISNHKGGTLYIGVTGDLINRINQHKNKTFEGFSSKYGLNKLVYYEVYEDIRSAISREKTLKKWNRIWKIRLIEESNPNWNDLSNDIFL